MGSLSGHGGGHRVSLVLGAFVLFFGLCLLFWAFFLGHVPRLRLMLISLVGVYIACIALAGINHSGGRHFFFCGPLLIFDFFSSGCVAPLVPASLVCSTVLTSAHP